jgi:hypothetical protein
MEIESEWTTRKRTRLDLAKVYERESLMALALEAPERCNRKLARILVTQQQG